MRQVFQAWAAPYTWGPWYPLNSTINGPFDVTVSAEQVSNVQGSFSGEVKYYGENGWTTEQFNGPGSIDFVIPEDGGIQQISARFKGHATGMDLRVTVDISASSSSQSFGDGHAQQSWPSLS